MSRDALLHAQALAAQGRIDEALAITTPLAEAPEPSPLAFTVHGRVLKLARRLDEALALDERAVATHPTVGVLWHNYGATLGDLGRGPAAIEAVSRAFALGLDAPESWAVMARARLACGDADGAEAAFREALRRAPGDEAVANQLADLVWMRDGDLDAAQAVLDESFQRGGRPAPLVLAKAKLFEAAGQGPTAAHLLALAVERIPGDVAVLLAASQAALETDRLEAAEAYAAAAERLAPEAPGVLNQLVILRLAQGRPDEGLAIARRALAAHPADQSLWGWAAIAARAVGDPLYGELYDYPSMVRPYDIGVPAGWPSLEAFLAELTVTLDRLHVFEHHPSAQSLRNGSQTLTLLTGVDAPALQGFFGEVDKCIRAYMTAIGAGTDPLRRRNTGDYRIEGAWSVRLKPRGFHRDHFHPQGWLSSAFYVETPDEALDAGERQGWIRFGQPPFKTVPPLPAEHFVRPRPGRLVLFPSYMWHGTVPFTTEERRLTIAFDVVPKAARAG